MVPLAIDLFFTELGFYITWILQNLVITELGFIQISRFNIEKAGWAIYGILSYDGYKSYLLKKEKRRLPIKSYDTFLSMGRYLSSINRILPYPKTCLHNGVYLRFYLKAIFGKDYGIVNKSSQNLLHTELNQRQPPEEKSYESVNHR